jgi:hypothetical protein
MIDVHLYGKLRRYTSDPRADRDTIVRVEPRPGDTLGAVLQRLDIPSDEVYHVFLNGALLSTHNGMAPWLGYQEPPAERLHPDDRLETPVEDGDRLGLFARDMPLLVV